MTTISHIVNPFKPKTKEQDINWQQPMVFESLRLARKVALDANIDVEQYACFYEEDESIVPKWMKKMAPLERSTQGKFKVDRKLPYMKDILDRLYESSNADYLIQTNIDIILNISFYWLIKRLIDDGHKNFCINKRLVPKEFNKVTDLPVIWNSWGNPHNGLDCFVFQRELYPKFMIGDIATGMAWSETTLTASMIAQDMDFVVFRNACATFHCGDDRTWLSPDQNDLRLHNVKEFCKTLKKLKKRYGKKFLKHDELQIFGWKLLNEANHYKWLNVPEIKYWVDRQFGAKVSREILSRLVGYN